MNSSSNKEKKQQFYCSVKGCPRGVDGGKPFPRQGQLKQHYDWMHAEKVFSCGKCGKKFGLKDVCSRHERECGKDFVCESCGASFRSKNSLAKHLKRKGHQPSRQPSNNMKPTSAQQVLVLLVPVTKKATEKKDAVKKDASTQTEPLTTPSSPVSQQFYDNLSSDITELLDLAIQTDVSSFSNEITSNELLDFGTQTSWGELLSSECSSQTPSDWPDCCLNKLLTFDSQTQTVHQSTDSSSQT